MIFTASYHGMLFSMYFHKQFLFYTRAHKSRVISLAKKLSVLDHCGDNLSLNQYNEIYYCKVEEKIQQFRHDSVAILKEMLEL